MTHDTVTDSDDDATIVVRRRALDDPDEATVVVERPRTSEASEPPDRPRPTTGDPKTGAGTRDTSDPDLADHDTVPVDRTGASMTGEHDTVVVDRTGTSTTDGDRTVALQRSDTSASEKTVAIERTPSSSSARAVRRGRMVVRGRIPAARAPRPAPIDPSLLRPARLAPGPGVLDRYGVRPAPEPVEAPVAAGALEGIPRVTSPGLPSVARNSRRVAGIGLIAVAAACAVSIAGLAWIIVALLSA